MSDFPDQSPRTPNEWGILAILSFFFGLFIVMELAKDFTPSKLAAPFFLVSWVVLLVLHELGHALMARWLGWRVERISIGTGQVRMRIWTFDMPVEFRTIPLSGYVVPRPVDLAFPRPKHCLIYFAGPGIELLAVALIGFCVGFDTLLTPSSHLAMIALQSFCLAAVVGAGFNLIPLSHRSDGQAAWSDGLGMLLCWRLSDEDYRRLKDGAQS